MRKVLIAAVRPAICCISVKIFWEEEKILYSNWFSKHLFVHYSKSLEDRIMASSAEKTNGTESKPPLASLASWVRLNVGGTVFATTVTTLAKDPDSFLYRICRTDDKDYLDSHKVNFWNIFNIETADFLFWLYCVWFMLYCFVSVTNGKRKSYLLVFKFLLYLWFLEKISPTPSDIDSICYELESHWISVMIIQFFE